MPLSSCAGLPWTFCGLTDIGDPGGGGVRFNAATPNDVSVICVSDACSDKRNPDVSCYVSSWDKSTTLAHRGTLILTRRDAGPEAMAIFDIVGSSTDREGWTELAVRHVQSFSRFENREPITVQFFRTGDCAPGQFSGSTEVRVIEGGHEKIMAALIPMAERIDKQAAQIARLENLLASLAVSAAETRA